MHTTSRFAAISLVVAACTSAGAPSVQPSPSATAVSATGSPPSATAASPIATVAPTPTAPPPAPPGAVAWPKVFDVELQAGRYWSNPPFRIPFSLDVAEPGWYSGHLHDDFFDLLRFDGVPHQVPTQMLGFADPDHVRGGDGDVPIADLTPDAALDQLAARASLTSSNRAPAELFGLQGARLDLHSATNNNPIFGSAEGNFGLGPELDVRLVLLDRGSRMFAVVILAPPGGLETAWARVLPMLDTVELDD